ncbi:hypothetical protein BC941DRAFT_483668 [Chlamydoabsidia padenii]|nr:hypothetical protein BC941DRAFT_483668 [Chlamydoabsidia padenii]
MYYHQHLDLLPDETVYAFWVGHDDIYEIIRANNNGYDEEALVDCIMHQMRNVRKVFGSNRYLMFTLAPTESMPYFKDNDKKDELERYKKVVDNVNKKLHEKVYNMVRRHQWLELDLVDTHDLLKDMSSTPTEFGFNDGQHSFWDTCQGKCNDTMDSYIWWDKTHLTGKAHRVIANSILLSNSLEPSGTILVGDSSSSMGTTNDFIHSPAGSRFRSPHFTAIHNTGLMEQLVKELNTRKPSTDNTTNMDGVGNHDSPLFQA